MTRDFRLPDVGEGIREAEVIKWMVDIGDTVVEDQGVLEVETDKAIIEIPSPVDGVVAEKLYDEGETAEVGDVIVRFETDEIQTPETDGSAAGAAAPEKPDEGGSGDGGGSPASKSGRVFAAPSTRRLARERGVDITEIEGSGSGGRVTRSDVERAAEEKDEEDVPMEVAKRRAAKEFERRKWMDDEEEEDEDEGTGLDGYEPAFQDDEDEEPEDEDGIIVGDEDGVEHEREVSEPTDPDVSGDVEQPDVPQPEGDEEPVSREPEEEDGLTPEFTDDVVEHEDDGLTPEFEEEGDEPEDEEMLDDGLTPEFDEEVAYADEDDEDDGLTPEFERNSTTVDRTSMAPEFTGGDEDEPESDGFDEGPEAEELDAASSGETGAADADDVGVPAEYETPGGEEARGQVGGGEAVDSADLAGDDTVFEDVSERVVDRDEDPGGGDEATETGGTQSEEPVETGADEGEGRESRDDAGEGVGVEPDDGAEGTPAADYGDDVATEEAMDYGGSEGMEEAGDDVDRGGVDAEAEAGGEAGEAGRPRDSGGSAAAGSVEHEEEVEGGRGTAPSAEEASEDGADETSPEDDVDEVRRELPYTGVRRRIGERLSEAVDRPLVTHHDDVDVTRLAEVKDEVDDVTYTPFVVKAVVAALENHPELNSTLDVEGERILLHDRYDVGVATATDDGLLVPVLRDAEEKDVAALSEELDDLVERAMNRDLAPEEMKDSTFTVTNVGAIGGEYSTPIVNGDETAILAVGRVKEKPRVVDGAVKPRHVVTLSLTFDHRVVDGAEAARFTNEVRRYLRKPALLLVD